VTSLTGGTPELSARLALLSRLTEGNVFFNHFDLFDDCLQINLTWGLAMNAKGSA
jgi:hypothetical protein